MNIREQYSVTITLEGQDINTFADIVKKLYREISKVGFVRQEYSQDEKEIIINLNKFLNEEKISDS
jgi:precorrin-3B methylase